MVFIKKEEAVHSGSHRRSRKVFNFNVNSQSKIKVSKTEETHHNDVGIIYSGRAYF